MGPAIGDTVLDRGGNCFDGLWKAGPATFAVLRKLRPDRYAPVKKDLALGVLVGTTLQQNSA